MSHWVAVLQVGDGVALRVHFNLALVVVGCLVLAGLPTVVHGQGAQIPQYPTTVDPYEVIVFEHEDYTGYYQSFKLDPTKRQLLVPFLDGSMNDKINSFRVGEKVGVTFFTHPKFQYFHMTSGPQVPVPPRSYEGSSTEQPISTGAWQYSKDASSLIVYHRSIGPIGVVMANDPISELSDVNHRFYPLFEDWSETKVCWKSLQDLDGETEYALIFPTRGTTESHIWNAVAHLYDGYGKVFVTLYDRPDCQGDWITLPGQGAYSTDFKLDKYEWDEKARSLEVRWEGPVPTVMAPATITGTATLPSSAHVRAPGAPTHVRAPSAGDFEDGVDRPGSNLRAFEVAGGPEECSQACAAEPQCRAFTWVRPGVQGPQARCWLKSEVPAAVANANCVSGLKVGQISAGTSNIAPIAPAGPAGPQQGPAPVDQAAGVGFPMLAEITLAPGGPPATYHYTAPTTGAHRMIAAWGSPVAIRLEVYGDGPDPWVAEGNPATVRFEAVAGMELRVRLSPVGSLPVTSVLQLHGGPLSD